MTNTGPPPRAELIDLWACHCGAQDEGVGDPPACWSCGRMMHVWGHRATGRKA